MANIQVVCPKCGWVSNVDPNDTKAICPKCGFSLSIKKEKVHKELDDDIKRFSGSLAKAEEYLQKEDWSKLLKCCDSLTVSHPTNFKVYAYQVIAITKHNFYKTCPRVPYQLKEDELDEDIRSRLYFYARKKYSKCSASTLNELNKFYPDYVDEGKKTHNKYLTKYDEYLFSIRKNKELYNSIKIDYLDKLKELAISSNEKKFVDNILEWGQLIEKGIRELTRYNLEAEAFCKLDYNHTPRPGNKGKYFFAILNLGFSIIFFILTFLKLIFNIVESPFFYGWPSLTTSLLENVLIILIITFFWVKSQRFKKVYFALSLILTIALVCVGIIDLSFTLYGKNILANVVMSSIGIAISLVVFCYALYFAFMYKPHNTYKCGTYIGNYKALLKNNFDVGFNFYWEETIIKKMKRRR